MSAGAGGACGLFPCYLSPVYLSVGLLPGLQSGLYVCLPAPGNIHFRL